MQSLTTLEYGKLLALVARYAQTPMGKARLENGIVFFEVNMGQIIIDLPLRVKRRYKIDDVDSANELLSTLKSKAKRVEDDSEKLTAEDLADIRAAKRARKGDFVSWKEVKESLDLD